MKDIGAPPIAIQVPKPSFAFDVLKLATGTGLAQVLGILAAPLLSRLFSPGAFGVAAVFTSITGVIGIVVCFSYDSAILLPKEDREAANVLALSLGFVSVVTLLTIPLTWFGRNLIFEWLKAPELEGYLWLIPITVLFGGIFLALRCWNSRRRQFALISIAQVLTTGLSVGAQIVFGFTGFRTGRALVVASLLGVLAADFVLAARTWQNDSGALGAIRLPDMLKALKRYSRFPKFSVAASILNNISWQLPAFFLAVFFSTAVVGEYSLGSRLLRIPMYLIGTNIANVFFQRATEAKHQGVLSGSVERTFKYLMNLSLFPCLLLALIGKDVFLLIFGQQWAEAGVYTQILSPWVCFWFVSSPLSTVFNVLEEQAMELKISILILVSRFFSLLGGGLLNNPRIALALFSSTGVLVYGYYCFAILGKSGVSRRRMLRILVTEIAWFTPAAVVIVALELLHAGPVWVLLVAALLLAFHYTNLIRSDPTARSIFVGLTRKISSTSLAWRSS